ncbi:putative capsule polysaccharide export outer membrane protein [Sphingomonas sp. MM-1]|uniref:polysaccharide biosynthesis/export family protein n=1 Tax=Sphingomonas sp. MM-1 TaxID=745310 RepID=UPI0002C0A2F0|nr:polysaccharide biosynthesis/export family protein [Sphingomonas sp. MM-1]AGH49937.1 putative capsule polysaccharide export outer membrane protein [Sphingomonas sp. MM-1]
MFRKRFITLVMCSALEACSTLPSSGPTGLQVRKSAEAAPGGENIKIVEVTDASALPAQGGKDKLPLANLAPPPTDMVGPGDVMLISIYEAGIPLFSGGTAVANPSVPYDAGVKVQTLPPTRVDDNGDIVVPYAGKLRVAGKTAFEVQNQIRNALRGRSQDPQVLVNITQVISNSVIVGGEVANPGRIVLQTNRERLSDVVALAGGQRGNTKDLALRVVRGSRVAELRFSDLLDNPEADVPAYPGDRLTVVQDPLSFSVLGASGRVQQIPFGRSTMSLAESVATAGGANPNLGDPQAIFVFRYVKDQDGKAHPVVYHFNMMNTGTYFLAQKFMMANNDILYFGSARANQPSKLIQLISQLFSPVVAVTNSIDILQNN